MTYKKKWPEAKHALCFIRPVQGCGREVQRRMIEKALKRLDVPHGLYESPIDGDKTNERGVLISHMRGNEVVVLPRLNVLARTRVEVKSSVSIDFMMTVSEVIRNCKYILVLDSNFTNNSPLNDNSVTSEDPEWLDVLERAANVVSNSRKLTSKKASEMVERRWAGEFRGVVEEWTKNPERADELQQMARVWRDPVYKNAKEAYQAMPKSVREQIKSLETARRIFGRRKPNNKNVLGRPKKKVNGQDELPTAIYDIVHNDSIIYTGMTQDPYKRFKTHKDNGLAISGAYMEIIEWLPTRADAFKQESLRIKLLQPIKNDQGTLKDRGRSANTAHVGVGVY